MEGRKEHKERKNIHSVGFIQPLMCPAQALNEGSGN